MKTSSMRSRSAIASASAAAIELRDLAVVALAERCGRLLGLADVLLERRVVGARVEIREVPRDLFRTGQLDRRHAPEPTGERQSQA